MGRILLIGGGHAHLSILRALLKEAISDEVTLISSNKYQYYSGMFSGYTEGLYKEEEIRIDLEQLCQKASVTFIKDTILSLDATQKIAKAQSGKPYSFDVVSFDIGSGTNQKWTQSNIINIKPNSLFPNEVGTFRSSEQPIVIGGGSAGVELALSTLAWRKENNKRKNVTLISSSPLLSSYGPAIARKIKTISTDKGLSFHENETVEHIRQNAIITDQGNKIEFTHVLPLLGPKASSIFKEFPLSTDSNGFLVVEDTLQNKEFPFIFGAGDCVTLKNYPLLPKNGVYAVRQGPILWKNLKRYMNNQNLLRFKPQKRFLSILSTGDKQGLLTYGRLTFYGKSAWNIKHFIDKRFMKKHSKY